MRESLKPIEPGCLAIVRPLVPRDPEEPPLALLGKVVTVGDRVSVLGRPHCDSCRGGQYHRVEPPGRTGLLCSCALIRIDPDEDQRARFQREADILERLDRLTIGGVR